MGKYSKNMIKRVFTKGPEEGFCAICRKHSKLTLDHVPPKGCNNSHDVILSTFDEFNKNPQKPKGVTGQAGTKFRTICDHCNNVLLGANYDIALVEMANRITFKLPQSKSDWQSGPSSLSVKVQPHKIARAVIGHLLAADALYEVTTEEEYPAFPKSLQEYFLSPSNPLPEMVDVFFWLHPFKKQEILKHLGRMDINKGQLWLGHVLKFDPLGFLVTWNAKTVQYSGVHSLFDNKSVNIEFEREILISRQFCPHKDFPLAVPSDSSECTLMPSQHGIYSTPKKKK